MSEFLKKLFLQSHPIETKSGAAFRVQDLFSQIEAAHGAPEARRLFEKWALVPTPLEINKLKNWRLLERHDGMDEKNIRELARCIVALNEQLPDDEQLTPRPRPTLATLESHLRELLRQRREAMEAGTWDGPVPGAEFNPFRWERWRQL